VARPAGWYGLVVIMQVAAIVGNVMADLLQGRIGTDSASLLVGAC
jgi:hypothetical protein